MSTFEFVFSLFGLLLGLSLAEVLGGMVKTAKLRRKVRVGWLTPMLGLFVMLDLLSFWSGIWNIRDLIPMSYGALVFGLAVTGLYYMAASMVFPDAPNEWTDFDDYYVAHRRRVFLAVWLSNVGLFMAGVWVTGTPPTFESVQMFAVYSLPFAAAVVSGRRWVNAVMLAMLIGFYAADTVVTLARSGN